VEAIDMPDTESTAALEAAVSDVLPEALDLSHRVHAHPEIAFEEHRAAEWTADLLRRHGFDVSAPAGGLETAFVARWTGACPGPVIAFAGEYDALPEVGHGCGHNLMCSSSAAAAIVAAAVLGRDFDGEIRFVGTPAEEAGNGKVHLIEAGVFDDVDVCLQVHPSDSNSAEVIALAVAEIGVTYHGVLAHASSDPWLGKNALDAIVLLHTMVAQWRQHLKPGERVHGIITHGGAAPNIVPDLTSGRWYLRTPVDADLDAMIERFRAMADAAALATGCRVELAIDPVNRCRTMLNNPTLLELWRRHLVAAGRQDDPLDPNAGSTDMANVSHELPTIHPYLAIAPRGTPWHSREAAAHAGGPDGDAMLPVAIRALAATALDLVRDPSLVARAWTELRAMGGGGRRAASAGIGAERVED
jgi:amidohydrolase